MKLTYKFGLFYLLVSLIAIGLGGVFVFNNIKEEIDKEQARYLWHRIQRIADQIEVGVPADSLDRHQTDIRILAMNKPTQDLTISDTMVWHDFLGRKESEVKLSLSKKINGKHYYISTHDSMVESDDITDAVMKSQVGIFILILVLTVGITFLISRYLLSPFKKSLKTIQYFKLGTTKEVSFPATSTTEFRKLNIFLDKMLLHAQNDYRSLKEFTDNASHELRTPLAIIRGKLELLLNSTIDDYQAKLISSAHNSVEVLSKLSQSLSLLTKLDNHEFETAAVINLSKQLNEALFSFQELIEMKGLSLEKEIIKEVRINMHPILSNILINNLLSNAIRHNEKGGKILVDLNQERLIMANTGTPLDISSEEMFLRFKKNNQNIDSLGLGLSIVHRICKESNLSINYEYEDGFHIFKIAFNS